MCVCVCTLYPLVGTGSAPGALCHCNKILYAYTARVYTRGQVLFFNACTYCYVRTGVSVSAAWRFRIVRRRARAPGDMARRNPFFEQRAKTTCPRQMYARVCASMSYHNILVCYNHVWGRGIRAAGQPAGEYV